jgi:ribonuclease J
MAKPDRLIYLALGGAGEVGMNMYLYGYGPEGAERFILVDMGVSFPTMESTPGVDLVMADPAWIQARADRLDAIFITHGHEDHVGALGLLWHRLRAPVYARRFTAALAKAKMERAGQPTDEVRQVDAWPHVVHAGPFTVGFLPIAHSIPESSALVITAPTSRPIRRRWSASHSTRRRSGRSATTGSRCSPAIRPTSSIRIPAGRRRC